MRAEFSESAEFVYIYIREAHPSDDWSTVPALERELTFDRPSTLEQRQRLARAFVARLGVETSTLVDDMNDSAEACYAAWPDRIYVIDTTGRIAYKSGIGPLGFDPGELREFLSRRLGGD